MSRDPRAELARREIERRRALEDPLYLASFMVAVDEGDGSRFSFEHLRFGLTEGEVVMRGPRDLGFQDSWRWQRLVGELMRDSKRFMALKGRQIGVTWLWLALDCAEALLMPGTTSVVFRQKESDAVDAIRRWWILYKSLPSWWREGIKVIAPDRGVEPGREGIKLMFPDGAISRVYPMTSSQSSGHGKTLRRALADEAAHIEYLGSIKKAIEPAAEQGFAKVGYVSTANGRSNLETGEGNRFHYDWVNAGEGVTRIFIPYDAHPSRDAAWYDTVPRRVLGLTVPEVNEQYPRDEHEAFTLTNRTFFSPDDLVFYRSRVRKPEYRARFLRKTASKALWDRSGGDWAVWEDPVVDGSYAISADVATGRGMDFSTAYVIDLNSGALVAQYRAKIDADLFAYQLHYMGRRYNTALIAVETGGGYGEAVIIPLRDGREGRPAYPKLYRHVLSSRSDLPISKPYGFPTNVKTRPLILNQLEKWVRDREIPYMSDELLYEMESFVYHDAGTSPRAQEGAHDDLVMAAAIAYEMYRLRGHHPDRKPRRVKRRYRHWLARSEA